MTKEKELLIALKCRPIIIHGDYKGKTWLSDTQGARPKWFYESEISFEVGADCSLKTRLVRIDSKAFVMINKEIKKQIEIIKGEKKC